MNLYRRNVELQLFITRSLPLGADLIPPFPDFQFDFAVAEREKGSFQLTYVPTTNYTPCRERGMIKRVPLAFYRSRERSGNYNYSKSISPM